MAEQPKVRHGSIEELKPDQLNFNRHTQYGMHLLEKSLRDFKFGRSIVVDKDNRIIGGNGVVETAAAIGEHKTIVVETNGDELVVVKRNDIDLNSPKGREMALADNSVAANDLEWNIENLNKVAESMPLNLHQWGVDLEALNEDLKRLNEEEEETMERGTDLRKLSIKFDSPMDKELAKGLIEKTLQLHGLQYDME